MEDLQVEDFNDPIEHKAEQTADGIKTPENQENDEEQTSIFKEIMSPFYRKPARICVWRARERGYCRIPVSG